MINSGFRCPSSTVPFFGLFWSMSKMQAQVLYYTHGNNWSMKYI